MRSLFLYGGHAGAVALGMALAFAVWGWAGTRFRTRAPGTPFFLRDDICPCLPAAGYLENGPSLREVIKEIMLVLIP